MIALAHFAGLVVTTIFAAAAAVLLDWLLLRAMFQLMRPAAASHSIGRGVDPATSRRARCLRATRVLF